MVQNKGSEFVELSFPILVRINSEEVPENIIKLSLSAFVKNFNNESLQVSNCQVSFASFVILIKVNLQFTPNQQDEVPLLVADIFWLLLFFLFSWGWGRQRVSVMLLKTKSKIFSNEVSVLSEGYVSIFISVK